MVSYLSRGYLSRLSPIPSFPEYTGPYKVGTVDVEIPVSELDAPSPAPDTAADLHTVQFRIFYPAQPDSKGKRISWLPAPQRLHVSAYTQFLGIGPMVASVLSWVSSFLCFRRRQSQHRLTNSHWQPGSSLGTSITRRSPSTRTPHCCLLLRMRRTTGGRP